MGHPCQALTESYVITVAQKVHLNKAKVLLLFLPPSCSFYQPAVYEARGWLVLRLLYSLRICLSIGLLVCASPIYHVRNNYVTYIDAMQFYRLRQLLNVQ